MAKLSALKKVKLLEQAVLNNDIKEVKRILAEEAPIEFTARAIGLACRFIGAEMVEALLDGGGTLEFEATPVLKRKYDCIERISGSFDLKIEFALFLLPGYQVGRYNKKIIPDAERQRVLKVLYDRKAGYLHEILYYAILFDDEAILDTLDELGVNEISEYRSDIVAGTIPVFTSLMRYGKDEFLSAIKNASDDDLLKMMKRYLARMKADQIHLYPSELYDTGYKSLGREKTFYGRYCSEKLFDFFVRKTDMMQKVGKWDLLYGLIDQNNAAGIRYALNEKWISTSNDMDLLLAYAQEKGDVKPELIGYILERQNLSGTEREKKKTPAADELSLDAEPLTVTEMKKTWGYKKQEDGTLIITSYKGSDTEVVIPSVIGKNTVTAISPDTFDPYAPRISGKQKKARRAARTSIRSVEFPGTIKVIPGQVLCDKHVNLHRVILNEGTEIISDRAFNGCEELETIEIPYSVKKIGSEAFRCCSKLKKIKLPDGITELGTYIFEYCEKLKSVKLPDDMTEIPVGMFHSCRSLRTIALPKGIKLIARLAFRDCAFKEFIVPDTVDKICYAAFSHCRFLHSVVVPEHVEFEEAVFAGCNLLANDKGRIIINGILFDDKELDDIRLEEALLKPLAIGSDIREIALDSNKFPIIVWRECSEKGQNIDVSGLSVGDEVYFGRFPETTDYEMKPLKWKVLAIVDGKALLITADCIIGWRWSWIYKETDNWEEDPIRTLLNEGFYNTAFSDIEKAQIEPIILDDPVERSQKADVGSVIEDRVSLLTFGELDTYMPSEKNCKTKVTEYAYRHGGGGDKDSWIWILRDIIERNYDCLFVHDAVYDSEGIHFVCSSNWDVFYLRPTIWIRQMGDR